MKFYKRYCGDITAKTGHLTPAEMGCYDRLLDHYYATEAPIPDGRAYSVCRAVTKADKDAADRVLREFFELTDRGWVQQRTEEEIADALPRIQAARENGKKGGRPRKEKPSAKPTGFSGETDPAPDRKAPQSQSSSEAIASAAAGAPAPVDKSNSQPPSPREAWSACLAWLGRNGTAESTGRELLGALQRDYAQVAVDAMWEASKHETPDPKSYLVATAKRMKQGCTTVPSKAAEATLDMLNQRALSDEERARSAAAKRRVLGTRGRKEPSHGTH